MKKRFLWLLASLTRLLLALRYRIDVRGREKVQTSRGVLILPNHPSEMDPVIVMTVFRRRLMPQPMVVEDFYYTPGLHWLFKLFGAVPMPNMEGRSGSYKRLRVQEGLDGVAERLDRGENVLLYPAGRLMRSKEEQLQGASAVFDLLQRRPDQPIVLVRTRGLIGSMFSWYANQHRPELGIKLMLAIKYLILNLILFMPRRKVSVEIEVPGDDFPRRGDKMEINRWLEAWYNTPGPEEPVPVSYYFWRRHYFQMAKGAEERALRELEVPDDVREKVAAELAELSGRNAEELRDDMLLSRDLGMDSLNLGELISWIEEEYGSMDVNVEDLQSVQDVQAAAIGELGDRNPGAELKVPHEWFEDGGRPDIHVPDPHLTVQENFFQVCDSYGSAVAIGDETSGVITYRKAKIGVLLLADIIRVRPERNIGIMLPATAGADLVILATLVAGKTPVMLNWTLGDANLKHVLDLSGIRVIISSARFLDRLDGLNFDLIKEKLWTLEEVRRRQMPLRAKLVAALNGMRSAESLRRRYRTESWESDQHAVILFTSGSEAAPKGVPLTHFNVLSNLRGALESIELYSSDVLYGFLPPFHSFGFTVTSLLPMVAGLKTCYYPNPTESRHLARGIGGWKPTVLCGTPTFISGILRAARDTDLLRELRIILSGAEKASEDLFRRLGELSDADILEGYGITETGPVLTFNRVGEERVGVGKPISNVKLCIVHPETREPVPTGERGLILASGPNIFPGYLGNPDTESFHIVDKKKWYVTGDLGFLDEGGNLTISGRLKRFVKIGGEMISLPAMEAALKEKYPDEDGEPRLAIISLERDDERPLLALFATFDCTVDEANQLLKDAGFSNLARIGRQIRIDELPKLGTGKADYQSLKRRLKQDLGE